MQLVGMCAGRNEYAVLSISKGQAALGVGPSQLGTEHSELVQFALSQSLPVSQPCPTEHGGQLPPQFTSVSSPLRARSVHEAAWQIALVQIALAQSLPRWQLLPASHARQARPPQSMSVSSPSVCSLPQVAAGAP